MSIYEMALYDIKVSVFMNTPRIIGPIFLLWEHNSYQYVHTFW
jgi:hypothetical protein